MRAAVALYEHPDFSESKNETTRTPFYTILGALTVVAATTAGLYAFTNIGKNQLKTVIGREIS